MADESGEIAVEEASYERVVSYLAALTSFFTGGHDLDADSYRAMRDDMISNAEYGGLAPTLFRRNRDTSSLWSFAKGVDPSWEPRRQYLRNEFEPLLQHLERLNPPPQAMPPSYDSSAWTGVQSAGQRVTAVKTLIPVAQSAIEILIKILEQPSSNGGPPLDEVEGALRHLKQLHAALGAVLEAAANGQLKSSGAEGLMTEASRYARRAAKALKHDPLPYATAATVLGLMTACGFPSIGGFLVSVALSVKKNVI
jgi:hypothetical protein